jgi:hypothetical protein
VNSILQSKLAYGLSAMSAFNSPNPKMLIDLFKRKWSGISINFSVILAAPLISMLSSGQVAPMVAVVVVVDSEARTKARS